MNSDDTAGGSLIFYGGKNYAEGNTGHLSVPHGGSGEIAAGSADWQWQSVAASAMHAFVVSEVDPADAGLSYLHHTEDVISASIPDLTALYSSAQFPLNYLGLDPAVAAVVWLAIDEAQASPNAVAATGMVGDSTTSITTLSLPGRPGALGFVALTQGSSVVANCRYGDYSSATGAVNWTGSGTVVLEYLNAAVQLISASGFPEGWSFSAPAMQSDGSWRISLSGGEPVSDSIISGLTADRSSITDDGADRATLTATVSDSVSGQPVAGESVSWSSTLGNLSVASSVSDGNGHAVASLTATAEGTATVVARLDNGSSRSLDITVTETTTGSMTLYSGTDWQGESTVLAEHGSVLLRSALSAWNWQSAKLGGEHLFSHTAFTDAETFDFRTYRDGYDVADVADLTAGYPAVLTAPLVQGVALGEDDVVVRVALLPSDGSQAVVVMATQFWPSPSLTASVTNGVQTVQGVLAVISRSAPVTVIPLKAGAMDPATGVTDWQVSTSLLVTWDAGNNVPVLVLDPATAPEGWTLWPAQPSGKTGEYSTVLSGDILAPAIVVRGARGTDSWFDASAPLVALNAKTLEPVEALWQYEGDRDTVRATRFRDTLACRRLLVRGRAGGKTVTLRPVNIAGNDYFNMAEGYQGACAALTDGGTAVAWGASSTGGKVPSEIASRTDLVALERGYSAFAALTASGGVVAWGNSDYGGKVPSEIASRTDLTDLAGAGDAFAALTASGGVVAWGSSDWGGQVPPEIASRTDLVALTANGDGFAALTASGGVVAWGYSKGTKVPPEIASRTDLVAVTGSGQSFAALTSSGGVVAWGGQGGDVPAEIASRTDLTVLAGNSHAFAALTVSGGVVAWGGGGGDVPAEIASRTDLVAVAGSHLAFAALTTSGGVVAWGNSGYGGKVPANIASRTDLVGLAGSYYAFAALTASGSVVAWGSNEAADIPANIVPLLTDVVAIYSQAYAFMALKSDHTVVVWGAGAAGNMNNVPASLQGNISYQEA